MRSAFIDIVRTRGFRGLYAGLSPTLVEIIPYAGLQFGTYDTFKRWMMVLILTHVLELLSSYMHYIVFNSFCLSMRFRDCIIMLNFLS